MTITADSRVSDIATSEPATIKVFQQHGIDFCCGGKIPLRAACATHGLDPETLLEELKAARLSSDERPDWGMDSLAALVTHIQTHYHEPLRAELPRLGHMMAKVVDRHGDRLPEILLPLRATFERLRDEMLPHMKKEDEVLFPAIVASERMVNGSEERGEPWRWIEQPVDVMEAEHASAGAALATMRQLTHEYAPPEDACPTFRGLYDGLAALEREMHVHVHLENNVLFPRAARLARGLAAR